MVGMDNLFRIPWTVSTTKITRSCISSPALLVRQTQGLDQNADNDPTGTESLHIKDWNVPFFEMSESPNQITPGKLIWEQ
jgi:hypothetical protein